MIPSIFTQASDCLRLPFQGYNSGALDIDFNYAGVPTKRYAVRVFDQASKGCTVKIDGTIPMGLPQPNGTEVEDARLFWHNECPYAAYTEGHYQRTPFRSKQRLAKLSDDLTFKCLIDYPWGDHATHSEKNHQFFSHDGQLFAVYSIAPYHRVINVTRGTDVFRPTPVVWPYGYMAGGTPPVRTPDGWVSFFHSYLPCHLHQRRYFAAAYRFNDDFNITGVTQPLWIGSEKDPINKPHPKAGIDWHPLVVFPTAAQFYDGDWEITAGINDVFDVRLFITHSELKFERPSAWTKDRLVYFKTVMPSYPCAPWERLGPTLGRFATNGHKFITSIMAAPGSTPISEQEYLALKKQRL